MTWNKSSTLPTPSSTRAALRTVTGVLAHEISYCRLLSLISDQSSPPRLVNYTAQPESCADRYHRSINYYYPDCEFRRHQS